MNHTSPLESSAADPKSLADLDRAGADRVVLEARLATISVLDGDATSGTSPFRSGRRAWAARRRAGYSPGPGRPPWRGPPEDGLLSLDEENALAKYAAHFSLEQHNPGRERRPDQPRTGGGDP